jgi:phenylalanyl-tRNA synthetase beta chain
VLLGVIGEVSPLIRRGLGIDEPAFMAGFDLARVISARAELQPVRSLARFPAVYQDLALVLPESVSAESVRRVIVRSGRPLVADATLFDLYRGERSGPGRRSLAYRITFQSPERTLTDREVAETHARIEAAVVRELGADVRGR